ncbi:MAG: hypothetical protein M1324_01470 [Patescibacteria group bacterium]|nr:hypothetical protein [Patescibacteria group bacterium]
MKGGEDLEDYEVQILYFCGKKALVHWRAWARRNKLEYEEVELDQAITHNGLPYRFRLTLRGVRELGMAEEERLLAQVNLAFVWVNSNEGFKRETNKEEKAHAKPKRGDWSRKPRSKKRRFANRV